MTLMIKQSIGSEHAVLDKSKISVEMIANLACKRYCEEQFELGCKYFFGRGVKRSRNKAFYWWKLAVDNYYSKEKSISKPKKKNKH